MRPVVHRFLVPPVLLGLHALFLLPILLANPPAEGQGRSPNEYLPPTFGVLRRLSEGESQSLIHRLHLKWSIPIGILGFAIVQCLKQLAGKVPLPEGPRWAHLASWIECAVLFFLGFFEELLRWGMVRWLVKAEGGSGGFRGRGELWDLANGINALGGLDLAGKFNTKYPSIWEGIYLMGWVWSFVECGVSWWTVRPEALAIEPDLETNSSTVRNSRSEDSPRRPLLGKRTRSDYSGIMSDGEGSERRNLFGSFYRKKRDLGTLNFREDAHHHYAQSNTIVQFATAPHVTKGDGSTTASTVPDDSTDATPTPRKLCDFDQIPIRKNSRIDGDRSSEHDYGDDEGSITTESGRSSMDSTRYQSQTPLLSSSLPYDPEQQHPHEQQALLTNQYRQTSYSTLSDLGFISSGEVDDEIVEVHEDDAEDADELEPNPTSNDLIMPRIDDQPLLQNYGTLNNSGAGPKRSPRRRLYPSWPSYSSAYHPTHFPANTDSGNVSTTGSTVPPAPPTNQELCESELPEPTERSVYGIGVTALPAYLPIIWRTSALMRHISHSMFFAWAPALVFQDKFQWWCFLVLFLLCGKKGYHTVEWFGGAAHRNGILKSSAMTMFIAIVIYIVSLGIWDILW